MGTPLVLLHSAEGKACGRGDKQRCTSETKHRADYRDGMSK